MNFPKMIFFDYGETLVHEEKFNRIKGFSEILKFAEVNKYQRTAEDLAKIEEAVNEELGRFDPQRKHLFDIEVADKLLKAYLFESQGIKLSITYEEVELIFWSAATSGKATEGIDDLLTVLRKNNIRTGIISNTSFGKKAMKERLGSIFKNHKFEPIIVSSEYVFRKPNPKIFKLALEKAGLDAKEVWYCGDHYKCDIVGAMSVGIQPIWYQKESDVYKEEDFVVRISKWSDLMKKIQYLCNKDFTAKINTDKEYGT